MFRLRLLTKKKQIAVIKKVVDVYDFILTDTSKMDNASFKELLSKTIDSLSEIADLAAGEDGIALVYNTIKCKNIAEKIKDDNGDEEDESLKDVKEDDDTINN